MKDEKLLVRPISSLLVEYSLPAIFGTLMTSIYVFVDGVFIGHSVGALGLAAINITWPIFSFSFAISIMLAMGGATVVSVSFGTGKYTRANRAFNNTLYAVFVIAMIFSFFSISLPEHILTMLGANGAIMPFAKRYLVNLMYFNFFFMGTYVLDFFVRNDEHPKFAMACIVLAAVLNTLFDYFFIVRFGWGMEGAAWATGFSQLIAFSVLIFFFLSKRGKLRLSWCRFEMPLLGRIVYNGFSEFATEMSMAIVTWIFNLVLIKSYGELGVSAFSIVTYVSLIVMMVFIGISQGLQPIVSYNHGAGVHDRVKKALVVTLQYVFVLGLLFYALFVSFAPFFIDFFIRGNKELFDLTYHAIHIFSISFMFSGLNIVMIAFLTSLERAKLSAAISLVRSLVLVLIGIMFLPMIFGNSGIWMSVPLSELGTFLIFVYLFKFSPFKKKIGF
ncbi:MATE family efflux transporter [Aureibacter tunicatorum]|uniref:Multidrug export protein MepA n=1 Tax=Aureibacter tunicatorum TaxID=866807 RepID=A0AAE4BQP4_9BACT|nr:MATE family efflux transporter [Aureibacter tunicatorum]MDR6237148.1 putative MATE family efflux protein [Aureibacter tunicatorum]